MHIYCYIKFPHQCHSQSQFTLQFTNWYTRFTPQCCRSHTVYILIHKIYIIYKLIHTNNVYNLQIDTYNLYTNAESHIIYILTHTHVEATLFTQVFTHVTDLCIVHTKQSDMIQAAMLPHNLHTCFIHNSHSSEITHQCCASFTPMLSHNLDDLTQFTCQWCRHTH